MAKIDKYSLQDFKKDFPTDEACADFIFDALHSRKCSCGGEYSLISGRRQLQCSKCRYQIAPTAGTIFHKSPTPLSLWFHAIFIFSNAKSGISAKEMERQLGVTYKCAYRILSLIRKALEQDNKPLNGIVETDTGYFGGRKNAGANNKNLKMAVAAKSVVMVAVERNGKVRAIVQPDNTAPRIEEFVRENVKKGSFLMTDDARAYKRLDKHYERFSVNHSKKQYVRGKFHINTAETFFGHLKRSIAGTYKSISKKHLQSYLDAFAFLRNERNDNRRFGLLMDILLHA